MYVYARDVVLSKCIQCVVGIVDWETRVDKKSGTPDQNNKPKRVVK